MLARLPYGVFALAAILYLAETRGSYAVAGLVDGAFGLGAAAGAPGQSRLIDRLGQRRVLVAAAAVDVTATGLLIGLTETEAPTVALVACGLAGGVAVPNVGGALRALWSDLLSGREPLLPTAFAIDSVALEALFTAGPLLAAAIIAVASPPAALVVSAGCSLTGTLAFVAQRPSRTWRPAPEAGARGRLGALRSSGVGTLAFAALRWGSASAPSRSRAGVRGIARPARAGRGAARDLVGRQPARGLVYGAITWRRSTSRCTSGSRRCSRSASSPACSRLDPRDGDPDHERRSPDRTPGRRVQPAPRRRRARRRGHRGLCVAGDRDARRLAPGTAIGGVLVEHAGWEWCFVAAALAALVGGAVVLRFRGTWRWSRPPPCRRAPTPGKAARREEAASARCQRALQLQDGRSLDRNGGSRRVPERAGSAAAPGEPRGSGWPHGRRCRPPTARCSCCSRSMRAGARRFRR